MSATTGRAGALARWWGGRTLLWRLVAGLLALLVLTCAVIGVSTTLALRGFLLDRLDRQLPRLLGQVAGAERSGVLAPGGGQDGGGQDGGGPRGRGGPGGPGDDGSSVLALRVVDGEVTGALLVRGTGADATSPAVTLDGAERAVVTALVPGSPPRGLSLGDLGAFRVQAFPDRGGDVLVVGLPTDEVRGTTARLVGIELVVFAVAITAAALVGAAAVRLSLRPLRRVAATAGAVAATPMATGDVVLPAGVGEDDERTEVGQVGAAFDAMLGQVGAALAQRQATEERLRRFVADASHELRTPLAVIRGHSELAGRRADELPDEVAHALARVHAESLRMGVLVDDLLLLARLDAGRPLAREEVDLTRLVLDATFDARAADDARAGGSAHRWLLELTEDVVTVVGDGDRLHQVLANLLANARTHTPPGTTVTTRLEPARAGSVTVSVTDDGPGIAPEVVDHVFERFVRADPSRTRAGADDPGGSGGSGSPGSSGLGLAIVEAVVSAHHGSVGVTSVPGATCFRVVLPGGHRLARAGPGGGRAGQR